MQTEEVVLHLSQTRLWPEERAEKNKGECDLHRNIMVQGLRDITNDRASAGLARLIFWLAPWRKVAASARRRAPQGWHLITGFSPSNMDVCDLLSLGLKPRFRLILWGLPGSCDFGGVFRWMPRRAGAPAPHGLADYSEHLMLQRWDRV